MVVHTAHSSGNPSAGAGNARNIDILIHELFQNITPERHVILQKGSLFQQLAHSSGPKIIAGWCHTLDENLDACNMQRCLSLLYIAHEALTLDFMQLKPTVHELLSPVFLDMIPRLLRATVRMDTKTHDAIRSLMDQWKKDGLFLEAYVEWIVTRTYNQSVSSQR